MADLKCPYCPEVRGDLQKLAPHVHGMHCEVPFETRAKAISSARSVETAVTKEVCCECGTDNPVVYHNYQELPFCGPCVDAHDKPTVETTEASHDRNTLTEGLTRMNTRLSAAGEQMVSMREALNSVDERMKILDAQLVSPSVIRHATLNEVWDKLMEEGNISGAMIVMDMIKASK